MRLRFWKREASRRDGERGAPGCVTDADGVLLLFLRVPTFPEHDRRRGGKGETGKARNRKLGVADAPRIR